MTGRPPATTHTRWDDIERSAHELARLLARETIELARGERILVGHKTDEVDVVTAGDLAIEAHLRARITDQFPDHAILGEEQGLDREGQQWTWVIDPIDATFNYATHIPSTASSIALAHGNETRVAAVAIFELETVLSCRKGAGASSDRGPLPSAMDPTSILGRRRLLIDPGHQIPDASAFDVIGRLMTVTPAVPRLLGSAVVSLATVAWTGGCFVGTGLNIWDAAAGVLLAEERGRIAQWWRYARDGHHHLIVGDPDLVRAYEHSMPKFIEAWRRKADNPHIAASELLGPSPTLLN